MTGKWKVRVDTGGTFTDAWALSPTGEERRCKIFSDGSLVCKIVGRRAGGWIDIGWAPGFSDEAMVGITAEGAGPVLASRDHGRWLQFQNPPEGSRVVLRTAEEAPVFAARIVTATPLGSKLPPMDLRVATTRGTNALLERKGARTVLFITRGFGDLPLIRDQRRKLLFSLEQPEEEILCEGVEEISGRLDAGGNILEWPDETAVRTAARRWLSTGIHVAAVALIHAWYNPAIERAVADWLLDEGFGHVSTSSGVAPEIRFLPRMETALADAWLSPVMKRFTRHVAESMETGEPWMMTSAGGLVAASRYLPKDSLLSGPAGGLVGAATVTRAAGFPKSLTLDMGGTSTDVARIDGPFAFRYMQEIGPARVMAPSLRIETVAAGGGSICRWQLGRLEVGPESAGATPGPACYGRGGPLTVTDVNLLLGLMNAGAAGIPLDGVAAQGELDKLTGAMRADGVTPLPDRELLEGLRAIAVEKMADAIRQVSLAEGHRPEEFVLFAFGGAGPQHACAVAERLGIRSVIIPGDAGLLSAWGLEHARRQETAGGQVLAPLASTDTAGIWESLAAVAAADLGVPNPEFRWLASLRLLGQDTSLEVETVARDISEEALLERFGAAYRRLYGYSPALDRAVECVSLRVVAEQATLCIAPESFSEDRCDGPRIIQDRFSTCVLPANWTLRRGTRGTLLLETRGTVDPPKTQHTGGEVRAALFRSRFEGMAGEMGSLLQRTALSANIKERLDFSCALLDRRGRLVVNAPHVPVHLGALGICVREVVRRIDLQPGDVAVTNHPAAGGSHLPDVTVIAGAFDSEGMLLGYVANRAHHAEIGGMAPGSMPAIATRLAQEGVVIAPMKWITGGIRDDSHLLSLLRDSPYPSRRPQENMADLEAQAASVAHGVAALEGMASTHGTAIVREEMEGILLHSSLLMTALLTQQGDRDFTRTEILDDGSPLAVSLHVRGGQLTVDFSGSGPVHPGNLNATPAIVRSALLYVLRLWLNQDVPLNEGLLENVKLILPPGILNPPFPDDADDCPAVVGGNVETSQRLADLLSAALGLCAHGQGTMNNFLFGSPTFGYYETIGGGAGAGPGFHGKSGRHVHMTNTAITDPEILEHRFPVRLHRFAIRRSSGGEGHQRGGDGLTREVEFLSPMTVSFLTQRRTTRPAGAEGGGDGQAGSQTRVHTDGRREPLPGIITYQAAAGERVVIHTPGGGGWGMA